MPTSADSHQITVCHFSDIPRPNKRRLNMQKGELTSSDSGNDVTVAVCWRDVNWTLLIQQLRVMTNLTSFSVLTNVINVLMFFFFSFVK